MKRKRERNDSARLVSCHSTNRPAIFTPQLFELWERVYSNAAYRLQYGHLFQRNKHIFLRIFLRQFSPSLYSFCDGQGLIYQRVLQHSEYVLICVLAQPCSLRTKSSLSGYYSFIVTEEFDCCSVSQHTACWSLI